MSMGTMSVVEITRVTTRYLKGFIAETSMASICSVTRIEPNSAPMLEPTRAAVIIAVTKGASALTIAMEIKEGSQEVAPKVASDGRDWLVNTIPIIKPVSVISGNDRTPTS